MELVSALAIVSACVVSLVHAFTAYKKSKEPPRDPVWDAALQLTLKDECTCDVDTFAHNYERLSQFKKYGCSLHGQTTIEKMVTSQESSLQAKAEG